jgi:16S rRNA processing protein RimM
LRGVEEFTLNTDTSTTWLPIATLLRAQGRRGELLAEPLSNLPGIFGPGREITICSIGTVHPTSSDQSLRIEDHWFPTGKNAGRIVLKLSGCDSINDAEALAGKQLLVPSASLPELACDLYDGDIRAGRIVDVEFATGPDGRTRLEDAPPLLSVQTKESAEPILVPFVSAWLDQVDIANKRVIMHLPSGLLDGPEDESAA